MHTRIIPPSRVTFYSQALEAIPVPYEVLLSTRRPLGSSRGICTSHNGVEKTRDIDRKACKESSSRYIINVLAVVGCVFEASRAEDLQDLLNRRGR